MHYFLCGFMASGKSTTLKEIENSQIFMGYKFIDLDCYIFEQYRESRHRNLGDLIKEKGFEWFRKIEKDSLMNIWSSKKTWTSLGGGTLDDSLVSFVAAREDISGFWINTSFKTCLKRIRKDEHRPLSVLSDSKLVELFSQREVVYKKYPVYNNKA